jgi:hypothetical protein
MKLITWDVIFGFMVIPKDLLTPLLVPWVVVFRIKRKSLLGLYISHMCEGCISEKFKPTGSRYNIRTTFKTKHILRSSLMKTRSERAPQQTARCVYSIPVNVAEATLAEQADFWPCGSVNTGTISKRVS